MATETVLHQDPPPGDPSERQRRLRDAFEDADAIMALEGFRKTPQQALLQAEVIAGRMTFDQAVRTAIDQARKC